MQVWTWRRKNRSLGDEKKNVLPLTDFVKNRWAVKHNRSLFFYRMFLVEPKALGQLVSPWLTGEKTIAVASSGFDLEMAERPLFCTPALSFVQFRCEIYRCLILATSNKRWGILFRNPKKESWEWGCHDNTAFEWNQMKYRRRRL